MYVLSVLLLLHITPISGEDTSQLDGQTIQIEATVCGKEFKLSEDGTVKLLVTLKRVKRVGETKALLEQGVLCRAGDGTREGAEAEDDRIRIGDKVTVSGTFRAFQKATNHGEFDLADYYQTMGLCGQITGAEVYPFPENAAAEATPGERLHRFRKQLCHILELCLSEKNAGIMKAMLLGEKGSLDHEIKNLYQVNGIIHILAISGLHISVLGMGCYRLLQRLLYDLQELVRKTAGITEIRGGKHRIAGVRLIAAVVSLGLIALYGWMTGLGASSIRAIAMFCLHLLAESIHRTYDLLTALSVAGVLLIVQEPLYLQYSGFLFSFSAVLGIALLAPAYSGKMMKGLSVSLATLPVYLMFYYRYPLYSILLNLIVIPLAGTVLAGGLIVVLTGCIWVPLGRAAGFIPSGILGFYEWLCRLFERLPGQQINLGAPSKVQVVIYILILMIIAGSDVWKNMRPAAWRMAMTARESNCMDAGMVKRAAPKALQRTLLHRFIEEKALPACKRIGMGRGRFSESEEQSGWAEAGRIMLTAVGVAILCVRMQSGLDLHVIDVGQGDGMLLRAEGENILIDGGSTDQTNVGRYRLIPLMQYYGVRKVTCIVTHEDADHINGVEELMQSDDSGVTITCLYLPSTHESAKGSAFLELEQMAAANGIPIQYLSAGAQLEKGNLRLQCLHPEKENTYSEPNERSVTLYLTYGSFRCLLNGDLEGEGEKRLLSELEGEEVPLTLLHTAHHGSNGATSEDFLKVFKPAYAFVSCGEGNRYGHPGKEAMVRLQEAGVLKIYDTRYCGEITFHTNGRTLHVQTFKKENE